MPSLRLLHSSLVEMKHSSNFATDPEQNALQLKLVAQVCFSYGYHVFSCLNRCHTVHITGYDYKFHYSLDLCSVLFDAP